MRVTVGCMRAVMLCAMMAVSLVTTPAAEQAEEQAPASPNVLERNFERPDLPTPSAEQLAALVPEGFEITDMLRCGLSGPGAELAVMMSRVNPQADPADWWLRWPGPSKLVILPALALLRADLPIPQFDLPGGAAPASEQAGLPAPLFAQDLTGDGRDELFVRTQKWDGGTVAWQYMHAYKQVGDRPTHVGRFGVRDRGGMYFLELHPPTAGREVILLHPIDEGQAQLAPRRYRVQVYGFTHNYYVLIRDHETGSAYTDPDDAYANLRRHLWGK